MPALFWVLAYSLVAHLAITLGQPGVPLALLGVVVAWVALRRRWSRLLAILTVLALVFAARPHHTLLVLYLTPIAIHTMLLWVFARTLRTGQTPLISRIALFMGAAPSEELARYTRRVTQAWCVFFALMATLALLLALTAPPTVWSAFTYGGVYVLLGLFFVVEYAVRMRMLPHEHGQGFISFVRALSTLDFRALARGTHS